MKPIKFDLKLANGTRIATLTDLENNLCAELLEPLRSGKLAKWLRVRNLIEQAEKVEALFEKENAHELQTLQNLMALFGGETDENLLKAAIAEWKDRLIENQVDSSADEEVEQLKAEIEKLNAEIETLKNPQQLEAQPLNTLLGNVIGNLFNTSLENKTEQKIENKRLASFTARDDGTAFDNATNLTWCRYSIGQYWENHTACGSPKRISWDEAMNTVNAINRNGGIAGFTDWRLPTISELRKLSEEWNVVLQQVFPNTPSGDWQNDRFWSSTSANALIGKAYSVAIFGDKMVTEGTKPGKELSYVRLVRG
jgi:hypothetical protein